METATWLIRRLDDEYSLRSNDPELYTRIGEALHEAHDAGVEFDDIAELTTLRPSQLLRQSFTWKGTPQGYTFWHSCYRAICTLEQHPLDLDSSGVPLALKAVVIHEPGFDNDDVLSLFDDSADPAPTEEEVFDYQRRVAETATRQLQSYRDEGQNKPEDFTVNTSDVFTPGNPALRTTVGEQHPAERYGNGDIECIDALRACLTEEEFRGYCKGNMIKYIWRERYKQGDDAIRKSRDYATQLVDGHWSEQ